MDKRVLLMLAMSASVISLAGCAGDGAKGSSPSGGSSGEVLVVPPPSGSESGATTAPANPPTVIIVPAEPQEAPPAGSMGGGAPGGTSEPWQEDFRRLDLNGDGLIDQSEAQGDVNFSSLFGRLDTNSDGLITPSEYEAMHSGVGAGGTGGEGSSEPPAAVIVPGPAVIVPQDEPAEGGSASGGSSDEASSGTGFTFQQLDGDEDTQVDKQEARHYPALSDDFDRADLNDDEVLTGSEYDAWSLAQEQSNGAGSAAGAGGMGGTSGGGFTFQQLDTDNDTYIDKQEARQHSTLSDDFDRADVNRDDVITGTEYQDWAEKQGG